MKLRKTKKGFTIVELVIVIAVIAILAAILIPTFASLTQKANVASDQSLKANLNTALRMQEAEDGEKNATMHDAVLDLDKQGFNLERITTKSNLFLLWDEDDNQFVLEDGQTANHKLWKIVNTPEEAAAEQNFSVYARQGDAWAGQTVTPHNGFDAGYNANISKVNYTNTPTNPQSGKEVVIRTNGGTLTINAASDTVNHYGEGLVLDIQAIAGSSYHEYGHFPKAEIKQGRIVVEDKGQVEILNVTGSGVVLDQVGSGSVELCYASSSENIPTGTAQVEPTVADIEIDDIVARTSFGVFTSLQNALDDFQAQGQKLFVVADITETMDANSGLCLYSKTGDFEIDGQGHIINASFVVNNTTTKIFFSNEEGKGIIRNTTINSTGIKYVFDVSTNGELLLENVTINADNCCVTSDSFGVLNANDCEFNFTKGEHTRNDHQEAWAPVSTQYGGTVNLFDCKLNSSDGYGMLVWPSGGTIEAARCSITSAKGYAVSWARNGAGDNTRADSVIRVNSCTFAGSTACEAKYNGTAASGTEAYVYKDGVLVATTVSE